MLKRVLFYCFFMSVSFLNAQYSFNGGLSTIKPFGSSKPFIGLHLGGEFPRDNDVTLYLRASFYAKQKLNPLTQGSISYQLEPLDPNDYTYQAAEAAATYNFTTFDGGLRYYILDGYDSGFALYGGSNVMGIFNKVKIVLDDFDKSKYRVPLGNDFSGTVISLGAGLSGGAKYTFAGIGSVYFDLTLDYLLTSIPSTNDPAIIFVAQQFSSPILFSFNIGFRKDIY